MDQDFSIQTALNSVLNSLLESVAGFAPKALTALGVFLIGYILAKITAKAIRTMFDKLRLNDLLEKVGLTDTLGKLGLHETPGFLLSRLAYYLILALFIKSAALSVGLMAVADAMTAFFAYLPNLLAATIVLFIGMIIAQFASGAVTRSARNSGVEFAPVLGRAVSSLIIFVVGLMAVTQLQIDTQIILSVVLILLSGGALALALTFGLGSREITRNLIAGFYARKIFEPGEKIEIGGREGILAGITPVHALIDEDGRTTTIPNSVFLEEAVRQ
ncbi:MAG: mechanosensitive ion channel [Candidatus Krumholzibacteria bacterium]|nr:mechanosensitive ion channel [Candidatus Krumholzibacteria bacterium]